MSHAVFVKVSAELFKRGHMVRFRAPGWSMHPTIRNGEAVTVAPISPSDIRRGDIVIYRCNGNLFTHRVVRIARREEDALVFTLRGDALGCPDEYVAGYQILGRVMYVERSGREINPYSLKARVLQRVLLCGSRLKRLIAAG